MAQKSDVAVVDIVEPITNSLTELKKKIRNHEKKKTKLDTLRSDLKKSGKPLNEDQARALARYEDISQQLDAFRELCKQLEGCSADVEKAYMKFLKKQESLETDHHLALEKYRAVLRVLESVESAKHFTDTNQVSLTEVELESLNSLRKVLLPFHSDFTSTNKFQNPDEFLKHVAEQQLNLSSGRAVQFLDEPIPQAKELLDRLVGSQYFIQHFALMFSRGCQVQKPSPAAKDRSRSGTISSQHGEQTPSVTHSSAVVLHKEHGDVHFKSTVCPTAGSTSGDFPHGNGEPLRIMSFVNSSLIPPSNNAPRSKRYCHEFSCILFHLFPAGYPVQNTQSGLPVPSAGSGPANHMMTSPMPSSYSVPTQPVDVMQNIDHFSPETINSTGHPRRDSVNEHSNQVSKGAAWQPVSDDGWAPLEQKSFNGNTKKSYQNPGDGNGNIDERVPRQDGNRYGRKDNRPGYDNEMNDGTRGRGRDGYAYGNGHDADKSGDEDDTDFGMFYSSNLNYRGRTVFGSQGSRQSRGQRIGGTAEGRTTVASLNPNVLDGSTVPDTGIHVTRPEESGEDEREEPRRRGRRQPAAENYTIKQSMLFYGVYLIRMVWLIVFLEAVCFVPYSRPWNKREKDHCFWSLIALMMLEYLFMFCCYYRNNYCGVPQWTWGGILRFPFRLVNNWLTNVFRSILSL